MTLNQNRVTRLQCLQQSECDTDPGLVAGPRCVGGRSGVLALGRFDLTAAPMSRLCWLSWLEGALYFCTWSRRTKSEEPVRKPSLRPRDGA